MKYFIHYWVCGLSLFLISCQSFQGFKGMEGEALLYEEQEQVVHTISKQEKSSKEVKEDLSKPYVSSYGRVRMDDNDRVDKWISYFQTDGREPMEIYLSRSNRYIPMMKEVLREYKLPEELVYVAMIESGFSPQARSFANAVGYWQFIAGTAKRYGLKVNSYVDERRDPVLSTRAAAEYFKDLYGIFGSWHLALASYNAGEYRINRFVMRHYTRDFWFLSSQRSFPRETSNYVPKFIAAYRISQNPKKYGFTDIAYEAPLEYDTVKLSFPVSLKKISQNMNISYNEIQRLNPRYRGEYVHVEDGVETVLRIPVGKKEHLSSVLAECRMAKPKLLYQDYYWYRVRRGDTLYHLARRNRTNVSTIRRINRMGRRSILRAGRKIKIPRYNYQVRVNKKGSRKLASTHTVQTGENLTFIANKYKVKVKKIKQINSLNSSVVHPGQVLKLMDPSSGKNTNNKVHIVRRGETLIGIAKQYKVSLPLLMKTNTLNFKSILAVGSRITIP